MILDFGRKALERLHLAPLEVLDTLSEEFDRPCPGPGLLKYGLRTP